MKNNLIYLIDEVDFIESKFHVIEGGMFKNQIINDVEEFQDWRQQLLLELQYIYKKTGDEFICGTISLLNSKWTGWEDKKQFRELKSKLKAIKDNIEKFSPDEESVRPDRGSVKPSKIFISHAEDDREYIKEFVELLEFIGIRSDQLFCSSVPGYDIPEGKSLYDYLNDQFYQFDLHMFYMLSANYYSSAAALNEMGAAWILKKSYTTILLPGFKYQEIKGAVDPNIISASLDEDRTMLRNHLSQIKVALENEFGLKARPDARWDEKVNEFIDKVNHISEECVSKDKKERKPVLKLTGIDENGHISDTLQISDFITTLKNIDNQYIKKIHGYFSEISKIKVDNRGDHIENGSSMILNFNEPLKISEDDQEVISLIAERMDIEISNDFFDLGNLSQNNLLAPVAGASRLDGTDDEKKKYRNLNNLLTTIYQYADWGPVKDAFSDSKCLKIALQNCGTDTDNDVLISLFFPKNSLIWLDGFPEFNDDTMDFLLDECVLSDIFGISNNENYLEYNASCNGSKDSSTTPIFTDRVWGYEQDYMECYMDELENVFCYEFYESKDYDIIRLKVDYINQHIVVAFPTVIFIREPLESVNYEIISKGSPDIIKSSIIVNE